MQRLDVYRSTRPGLLIPLLIAMACDANRNPAGVPDQPAYIAPPSGLAVPELTAVAAPDTPPPAPPTDDTDVALPSAEGFAQSGVSLRRLLVSRAIEAREPIAPSEHFEASSEPLFAFLDVRNETTEEQTLTVTFEGPGGRSTGHVELRVPANVTRFRTWAYSRNVTEPGTWLATVKSRDGVVLGRRELWVE